MRCFVNCYEVLGSQIFEDVCSGHVMILVKNCRQSVRNKSTTHFILVECVLYVMQMDGIFRIILVDFI